MAVICGRGRLRLSPALATAMAATDSATEATAMAVICGRGRLTPSANIAAIVVASAAATVATVAVAVTSARGPLRPSPRPTPAFCMAVSATDTAATPSAAMPSPPPSSTAPWPSPPPSSAPSPTDTTDGKRTDSDNGSTIERATEPNRPGTTTTTTHNAMVNGRTPITDRLSSEQLNQTDRVQQQ